MEILEKIANDVLTGNKEGIISSIDEALGQKMAPVDIIQKGMRRGIEMVGERFEKLELYLPEMMLAADTMKAGVDHLKPHMEATGHGESVGNLGTIIIGTVQNDLHDIGKNLVSTFLQLSGFEVHDLGIDVPAHRFAEEAEKNQADLIGISALLTSTMENMREVIEELEEAGIRDKYKIIVGGGPVTQDFADQIQADGYGEDFSQAAMVAKEMVSSGRERP